MDLYNTRTLATLGNLGRQEILRSLKTHRIGYFGITGFTGKDVKPIHKQTDVRLDVGFNMFGNTFCRSSSNLTRPFWSVNLQSGHGLFDPPPTSMNFPSRRVKRNASLASENVNCQTLCRAVLKLACDLSPRPRHAPKVNANSKPGDEAAWLSETCLMSKRSSFLFCMKRANVVIFNHLSAYQRRNN